jgi:hypothetical protein
MSTATNEKKEPELTLLDVDISGVARDTVVIVLPNGATFQVATQGIDLAEIDRDELLAQAANVSDNAQLGVAEVAEFALDPDLNIAVMKLQTNAGDKVHG